MAAKVKWDRGAWWIITHHKGDRTVRRIGPTNDDKRQAEQIKKKINAAITLGSFGKTSPKDLDPLPCDEELLRWHTTYSPTMKPTYRKSTESLIRNHLDPYFGSKDLRNIREADLLSLAKVKLDEGLAPRTVRNALAVLRRVMNLLQRDNLLTHNPADHIGELMRRVGRSIATEVEEVETWNQEEIEGLIAIAREHQPQFAPILIFLLSTGVRRGEALGLYWRDVDLASGRITIRRSMTEVGLSTPKNGRSRIIGVPPGLHAELTRLLDQRHREQLKFGWSEIPDPVFCTKNGTIYNPRNVARSWDIVRRRGKAQGIRPLKLHAARHTWATLALESGRSIKWVADQLGHSDPSITLRTYVHALPTQEGDLEFANFGGTKRHYTAPGPENWFRKLSQLPEKPGAPDRIRTCDLRFRKPLLYPC
jgi:integrase